MLTVPYDVDLFDHDQPEDNYSALPKMGVRYQKLQKTCRGLAGLPDNEVFYTGLKVYIFFMIQCSRAINM